MIKTEIYEQALFETIKRGATEISPDVKDAFEKYIIYNDDVAKNKWLKEQDIATLIKLINFCINSVIVKRFSLKDFEHFADIMFGLEKGKIKVLWDIILENKKELQVNYIISKLDELTALSNDND